MFSSRFWYKLRTKKSKNR